MQDPYRQLKHTKTLLSVMLLVTAGTILIALGRKLMASTAWYAVVPLTELGGILIGAGLLSVWLDTYLRREQDVIEESRLRRILTENAPAMRDAVIQGFAGDTNDLKRVATPELLDQVITNSLGLRLDDHEFASEIYTDIREQAIMVKERWHDAILSVQLSPLPAGSGTRKASPTKQTDTSNPGGYFSVTVRWEYRTVLGHDQQRFVCTADRGEYDELRAAHDGTYVWHLGNSSDLDAAAATSFELLSFTVDGKPRTIRRYQRKDSQTYTVNLGERTDQMVTVAYTYRTLVAADGNLLFFSIDQPTNGLKVDLDYRGTGIERISVLDLIPSVRPTRIERPAPKTGAETIRIDIDGWIFPRSGVAWVWGRPPA